MVVAVSKTFMRQHETPWPIKGINVVKPNEPSYYSKRKRSMTHMDPNEQSNGAK